MSRAGPISPIELFDAASRLPASERGAYLDAQCGPDGALRKEVESLLRHHDASAEFLETGPFKGNGAESHDADQGAAALQGIGALAGALPPGSVIGSYTVERMLGEGGMGVVYVAQQASPARRVALKMIRFAAAGGSSLRRFEREGQLLGRLQHPGIAQIFEAGAVTLPGGVRQPYLAMELVEGRPLNEYALAMTLGVAEKLALMAKVCDAVQHAHQRGMVHRDLKPGNILVTAMGDPKVLDFGVARALDGDTAGATLATEQGQLLGTLGYMSPEQVAGDAAGVDARSDIYSLGVILYELLTRHLPHEVRGVGVLEGARRIREGEPRRLADVSRALRGDVDTIVMMALAKDPARRYQSAAAMADDLRRSLAGLPIVARQDSALYVLQKSLRRYRWALAAGVVFALLLGGWGVWAGLDARAYRSLAARELRATDAAVAKEQEAREMLRRGNVERGRLLAVSGDMRAAENMLWEAMSEKPGAADAYWALCEMYAKYPVHSQLSMGEMIRSIRYSPDGKRIAAAGYEGGVAVFDVATGSVMWKRIGHKDRVNCVRFTPDGRGVASGGLDSEIRLWNAEDGEPRGAFKGHRGSVADFEFTADGATLVSVAEDTTVRVWDVAEQREIRQLKGTGQAVWCMTLTHNGTRVVIGDHGGTLQSVNIQTGAEYWRATPHRRNLLSLSLRPDGGVLASGAADGLIVLTNPEDGTTLKSIAVPATTPRAVSFSPDGARIVATCTWTTLVLDAATLEVVEPRMPELQNGWNARFSPDGRGLATTAAPGSIRLWDFTGPGGCVTTRPVTGNAHCLAASPDGREVAAGYVNGSVVVIDPRDGREVRRWTTSADLRWLAYSRDGGTIAVMGTQGRVSLFRATGELVKELSSAGTELGCGEFDQTSARFFAGGNDGTVRVWDVAQGVEQPLIDRLSREILGLNISPDGRLLAVASRTPTLRVYDVATGKLVTSFETATSASWNPVFSPDSRYLTLGNFGNPVEIFDVEMGTPLPSLASHTRIVPRAVFSPDGRLVVTVSGDGLVKVWNPGRGQCLATLRGCGGEATSVVWVPGSRKVAVGYRSGELELWDLGVLEGRVAGNAGVCIGGLDGSVGGGEGKMRLREWMAGGMTVLYEPPRDTPEQKESEQKSDRS